MMCCLFFKKAQIPLHKIVVIQQDGFFDDMSACASKMVSLDLWKRAMIKSSDTVNRDAYI